MQRLLLATWLLLCAAATSPAQSCAGCKDGVACEKHDEKEKKLRADLKKALAGTDQNAKELAINLLRNSMTEHEKCPIEANTKAVAEGFKDPSSEIRLKTAREFEGPHDPDLAVKILEPQVDATLKRIAQLNGGFGKNHDAWTAELDMLGALLKSTFLQETPAAAKAAAKWLRLKDPTAVCRVSGELETSKIRSPEVVEALITAMEFGVSIADKKTREQVCDSPCRVWNRLTEQKADEGHRTDPIVMKAWIEKCKKWWKENQADWK